MQIRELIFLGIIGVTVFFALYTCPFDDLASSNPVEWLADSINGFFDLIFNLTNNTGGPAYSRYVMALHIYNSAFRYSDMGYACALAMILFAVIFVCTLINWKYGRKGTEINL